MVAVEGSPQSKTRGGTEFGPLSPPGFLDIDSPAANLTILLEPPPVPDDDSHDTPIIQPQIERSDPPVEYTLIIPSSYDGLPGAAPGLKYANIQRRRVASYRRLT